MSDTDQRSKANTKPQRHLVLRFIIWWSMLGAPISAFLWIVDSSRSSMPPLPPLGVLAVRVLLAAGAFGTLTWRRWGVMLWLAVCGATLTMLIVRLLSSEGGVAYQWGSITPSMVAFVLFAVFVRRQWNEYT